MAKYYAQINGNATVTTNFKPNTVWTNNNSYLRLEYNGDITTTVGGICPFFAGQNPWFCLVQDDLNQYDKKQYLNIGSTTYFGTGYSWNTNGFETTTVMTFLNGTASIVKGEQSHSGSFGGNIPNNNLGFFSNYANNLQMDFYELKVYGENETLLYDFVPYLSGTSKGIYDKVNEEFFPATNQAKITLVELSSFDVEPTEISATSGGSAYTVNVSADTEVTWTASTSDSWIGLSSPTGTGNGSFTVNIPATPEYAARSGEITVVSSDEGEATISVSQEKKAVIFTRRDIYRNGNQVNKMYRSGELIFQRIEPEIPPTPSGYSNQYLTFEILSAGTINWKTTNSGITRTIQYSKNNGLTWNSITSTSAGTKINVAAEDKVLFKGDNDTYGSLEDGVCTFSGTTAKFNVEGNIMSLINSTNFSNLDSLSSAHTFSSLFSYCTGLTDASNLILPATTLAIGCYDSMFRGCTSLTTAPELPATTLTNGCYSWMFTSCYSLTTAPALPAETLADYCYHKMFSSCSGLTQAPELPATTLAYYCYQYMFSGCKNLNYVKCLATNISATDCTYSWLNNVASAGTFVKSASMTDWTTGKSGIPSGWTVQDDVLPYDQQYLTFIITSGGNIYWKTQNAASTKTIEYRKNGGEWSAITSSTGGVTIGVVSGDTLEFRGDNAQYAPQDGRCSTFTGSTAGIILQGNIMSLVDSTGFTNLKDFTQANVFMNFFNNCKGIESAENLILPATGLTNYCYQGMLANCTNLTRAPKLPAETLADGCYNYLFYQSSNVNYIECLTTTNITSNAYTQEWVRSVQTTSGTFVKKSGTTISQGGSNGIPRNWTIENV